ncbi:MAG: DVU_1556 family methyltransferase [Pelobacteraceae bacterium]
MRTSSTVYESGPLRDVTGTTIRPGGLMLTDRALAHCSFAAGAQLLDVGCGAGASVEHLRSRYGFDARGVDISSTLIAEGLRRNPDLLLSEAEAEAVPYPDESHDGIICECVLSLLTEPLRALTEFRRLLRSGGYLILSDMYRREPATGQPEAWLSENGFTMLLWEDHTHLLRELAARLILANGSLEGLCCRAPGSGRKPGYYLLVAHKD